MLWHVNGDVTTNGIEKNLNVLCPGLLLMECQIFFVTLLDPHANLELSVIFSRAAAGCCRVSIQEGISGLNDHGNKVYNIFRVSMDWP